MFSLFSRIYKNVVNSPEKIILSDDQGEYSNEYFWNLSSRVFSYLSTQGIGRESVVLVHLPRGAEAVIALFGVFRAGAVAVVLEENGKEEWYANVESGITPDVIIDRAVLEEIRCLDPIDGYHIPDLHDLAFIAFTTGTTGRQKAVMHEYGTIERYLTIYDEEVKIYKFMLDCSLALTSSLHTSIVTLTSQLAINTLIDIVPYEIIRNIDAFSKRLCDKRISSTFLSPAYLNKYGIPASPFLFCISLSFEPLTSIQSDNLMIFNEYGMRETGGAVCEYQIDRHYDVAPIGKPLYSYELIVVDPCGKPVPDGELGEICVNNEYCRGYLNMPEETGAQFRDGWFHTRDLGKRMSDGNYIVYGRTNDAIQTKNGLVVALEIEVEARKALNKYSVYVKVFPTENDPVVCLYSDFDIDFPALQNELRKSLPDFKIPTEYVRMDSFEYNNGKAVRVHLPDPSILVSVICLAHNHEAYIRDAIEGFLMQKTSFRYEIIIHDDCSSDSTARIIREYESRYPGLVRGIYQDHNRFDDSVLAWRDFLLSKARGKYIAISDGDDYWTDPLKLEKQMAVLSSDDTLMACITSCAVVDKDKKLVQDVMSVVPDNKEGRYTLRDFLSGHHNWPVTTVVFNLRNFDAVFERYTKMENSILGDWTMWVALLCEGDAYFLNDVTACYRLNPTSQTHTNVDVRRMGQAKMNFWLIPIVADILPEGYDDVRFRLLNDNASWWWNLANAHKHCHHYFRMSLCLAAYVWRSLRYFVLRCFLCSHYRIRSTKNRRSSLA